MVKTENLIVEGKCLIRLEHKPESILKVKKWIANFMLKKGYGSTDANLVFEDTFLSMNFQRDVDREIPLTHRLRKKARLISDTKIVTDKYYNTLEKLRSSIPFRVNFCILPKKQDDVEVFIINIRAEPAILFKIRQLGKKPILNEFEYSDTIQDSKQFINEIMLGLGAQILEKPEVLEKYVGVFITPVIERLEKLEFKKVVELLKIGRSKIEKDEEGRKDGLTDLRSALEIFIHQIVGKTHKKPKSQSKVDYNLKILEQNGYLNSEMGELISRIHEWLYRCLSNQPLHHREKVNLTDARFLFSISEECMDYLLEKVLQGR